MGRLIIFNSDSSCLLFCIHFTYLAIENLLKPSRIQLINGQKTKRSQDEKIRNNFTLNDLYIANVNRKCRLSRILTKILAFLLNVC